MGRKRLKEPETFIDPNPTETRDLDSGRGHTRSSIRKLVQYRDLTDEEFEVKMDQAEMGIKNTKALTRRIEAQLNELAKDYDITDLKVNDKQLLRAWANSVVELEDLDAQAYQIRLSGITQETMFLFEKIGKARSEILSNISSIQRDLNITRKLRKGDNEATVIGFLDDLKQKARKFYESKMGIIICPKCSKWVASIWFLDWDARGNKLEIHCTTDMGDGKKCGEIIRLTSKELIETRGNNRPELLPESMK